jgi:hypothetical protein
VFFDKKDGARQLKPRETQADKRSCGTKKGQRRINTTQQTTQKKKKIHELFGHVALLRIPGPSLRRCEHFVPPTQTHQTTSESIIAIVAKNKSWRRKEIVVLADDDESRRRTRFFHQRNLGVDRR